MIAQVWSNTDPIMVPVAVDEPGAVCTQFPAKVGALNPDITPCSLS
jgi:hypothetical protein